MTFKRTISTLLGLLMIGSVLPARLQPTDTLHVVIGVEGEAYISHFSPPENYSDGQVLTAGSFIRSSDIVEVGPGSSVVILCANQITEVITDDFRSPNCASEVSEPLVAWNSIEIYGQQRAATDDIVYVISPRNTMVMSSKPAIDWTPIAGASERGITYRVTLFNMIDNSIVWQVDGITSTHLDYPEDKPALAAVDAAEKPIQYQFVVTPVIKGEEMRNFDPMRPEGFCIVSARHRPSVEQSVSNLSALTLPNSLSENVRSFNLAVFYHGRRLYNDALNELIKILPVPLDKPFPPDQISARSIVASPSYYILLGNILYAQRLPFNQVEPAYKRAQEIALSLNDTVALATINEQLADILRGRKPSIKPDTDPDVYKYYENAKQYYAALDDQAAVQQIDQKLQTAPQIPNTSFCG